MEEGIKLGISLLKDFLKDEFSVERLDVAYVDAKEKKYTKLNMEELKKYGK